ncbi:GumC family protein [Alsobacter sp. R-9]
MATQAPETGTAAEGAGDLDLAQLSTALSRARWWILVPTAVVAAGAAVAVNMVTPRYTAETKLILQSGDTPFTRPVSGTDAGGGVLDERDLGSQVLVAASRDVARAAIEQLGLRGNPDFDRYAQPSGLRGILAGFGLARAPTEAEREEALIDRYRERVLAFTTGLSRVMTIEFSAADPQLAARGANTVAQLFLEAQAESKKQAARTAGAWLLNTIEPLREKVALAEARVEEFRARKGLLAAGPNATLPQQQLVEMNTQLSTARSAQADAQARARLIQDALAQGRPLEISDVANNELVRKLVADRATLRAQIALESRTLLPQHPRMKELQAQLAAVDADIRASAEKAVRTLENDARVQGARVDQISAALDALKQRSAQANEDEVELRALEREARTQREQLEAMMARYRDAIARDAKDAVPPDARVISTATVPGVPSFPKKLPIILVSAVSTLLVGATIVVTRELLSGRAYVGAGRGVPSLPVAPASPAFAAIPSMRPEEEGAGDREPSESVAGPAPDEADASVPAEEADHVEPASSVETPARPAPMLGTADAVQLLRDIGTAPGEAVFGLVVSPSAALARSEAFALGRRCAATGRVVLVDLVRGRPDGDLPGFGDVVAGTAGFVDVLHRDPGSRLHLVAPGAPLSTEAGPDGMERCVDALRRTYDMLLVCAPSPEVSREAQVLAASADCLLVVSSPDALVDPVALAAALPPGSPEPTMIEATTGPALAATA